MSYEAIAVLMFSTFMLLLLTGQRVFGAIGFIATVFALALWGEGAVEMPFASTITLNNWYPMLTLPMFVYMGYMLSESGIAGFDPLALLHSATELRSPSVAVLPDSGLSSHTLEYPSPVLL